MDDWRYRPARDLDLAPAERHRSLRRESGLLEAFLHTSWHLALRGWLAAWHRLSIEGREHLPAGPPFILVANHASHLDALVLAAAIPARICNAVFPVAAGDTFFEVPGVAAFSALVLNALPLWRKNCGPHELVRLRERLIGDPCAYLLFPEGTRSRTGKPGRFKPGLGMLVAGTPVPVIPCRIVGAFEAWPPETRVPRPRKVRLRIGSPLSFESQPHTREGWIEVARKAQEAVEALQEPGPG